MAGTKQRKYITDDKHFMGVPKIEASPEEILRAMFRAVDKDVAARTRRGGKQRKR